MLVERVKPILLSGPALDHLWALGALLLRVYVGVTIVGVHGLPKVGELLAGEGHLEE